MRRVARQPLGQEIREAADSDSAWQEVLAHWPAAVVSDVAMPRVSGIELCRRLMKSALDIKVVISTAGMATEEEPMAAIAFGSAGHPKDVPQ